MHPGLIVILFILALILLFAVFFNRPAKIHGGYNHTITFVDAESRLKLLNFYKNALSLLKNNSKLNLACRCISNYIREIEDKGYMEVPQSKLGDPYYIWKAHDSYIIDGRENQIKITDVSEHVKNKLVKSLVPKSFQIIEGNIFIKRSRTLIYPHISLHIEYEDNPGIEKDGKTIKLFHGVDIKYAKVQEGILPLAASFIHFGYEPHGLLTFAGGPGLYTSVDLAVAAKYTTTFLFLFTCSYKTYTFHHIGEIWLDETIIRYATDNYDKRWIKHCPVKYFLLELFFFFIIKAKQDKDMVYERFEQVLDRNIMNMIVSKGDSVKIMRQEIYNKQHQIINRSLHEELSKYDFIVDHLRSTKVEKLMTEYEIDQITFTPEIAAEIQEQLNNEKSFEVIVRSSKSVLPYIDVFFGMTKID